MVATIYVLDHEWHTEISVPTAPLTGGLTRFRSIFPSAAYLSFGFGERLYFQKAQTGAVDMVSAIFPGPGTVLTTALGPPSEMYADLDMVPIRVTQAELDRLADYLWDSFEKLPTTSSSASATASSRATCSTARPHLLRRLHLQHLDDGRPRPRRPAAPARRASFSPTR
jgi:hypothetical protein